MKKQGLYIGLMIFLIILVDQILKFWIKLNFVYGDGFDLFGLPWAKIQFVENEGMAFGWLVGGKMGKLLLTSFRMIAVPIGFYYIYYLIKNKYHPGLVFAVGLIVSGALGNLIDSIFYGVIFSHSFGQLATLFPPEGGYGELMHGRVVDMFYFPLVQTTWPRWIPIVGGSELSFFQYIFNVADSAISIGVMCILIFNKKFLQAPLSISNDG